MDAQLIMIILIAVCLIALAVILYKRKPEGIMSIKESIDLCELPVVTLYNNEKKFNFLLDTGSTDNHISSKALKHMSCTESDKSLNVYGFNGNVDHNKGYNIRLNYKDKEFHIEAYESKALDTSFEMIKKENGVTLHGILGSKFLTKYGYILDFYKLIVYAKK